MLNQFLGEGAGDHGNGGPILNRGRRLRTETLITPVGINKIRQETNPK